MSRPEVKGVVFCRELGQICAAPATTQVFLRWGGGHI